jgi:hypothetical protein
VQPTNGRLYRVGGLPTVCGSVEQTVGRLNWEQHAVARTGVAP